MSSEIAIVARKTGGLYHQLQNGEIRELRGGGSADESKCFKCCPLHSRREGRATSVEAYGVADDGKVSNMFSIAHEIEIDSTGIDVCFIT